VSLQPQLKYLYSVNVLFETFEVDVYQVCTFIPGRTRVLLGCITRFVNCK
jgi:hypothetical protein